MSSPDRQAVDQILSNRRPAPESYRDSGLAPYRDLASWPPDALALVPVGIAAAIESYVRDTIRELVDAGDPFVDRIDKLELRTRPGLDAMKALHGRRISLGEWVSHLVRISSVAHLAHHLSTLFGTPSLQILLAETYYFTGPTPTDIDPTWEDPDALPPQASRPDGAERDEPDLIVDDPGRVVESLGSLFTARHRAAHEAVPPQHNLETLTRWVDDAELFCTALSNRVNATLRPLEPFGTPMMEFKASTDLDRAQTLLDERMEGLCARLAALPQRDDHRECHWSGLPFISPAEFATLARLAQEAYKVYKEAELDFQAYYWPDGTGWKTWRMSAELDLVEERSRRVAQSIRNADEMLVEEEMDAARDGPAAAPPGQARHDDNTFAA